jgi:glycosyltransferase involved in cell wall biosynthesis
MLKVIAYTGGHNNPSGVHRVRRYAPYLRNLEIILTECPSRAGSFPPARKWLRPAWGLWNLAEHVPGVMRSYNYDVTLFQREMLASFVSLEPLAKQPRILDVDDAIWVHRGGTFARRLAGLCDHIICGNGFLAQEFARWNPSVSVLPTPVDTERFVPGNGVRNDSRPIIGWQGQYSNFPFLYQIESALAEVLRSHPQAVLRIVSGKLPHFKLIPADRVEFVHFSWEREVADIQEMTIGIMPINDGVVSRGKCSFKMLLYMACGIPVVVSPFGMNGEVLQKGEVGLGAIGHDNWVECLNVLLNSASERERMGKNGRAVVLQHYSLDVLAAKLAETLTSSAA